MHFPRSSALAFSCLLFVLSCPAFGAEGKPQRARALAAGCGGCHGSAGQGYESIPSIARMPEADFVRRMQEFRTGKPGATVMNRIAQGYSDEEFALLASHFAHP